MPTDLTPLENAIGRLNDSLARYEQDVTDLQIRERLIQRFEFTYDLAHKMLRRVTAAIPQFLEHARELLKLLKGRLVRWA